MKSGIYIVKAWSDRHLIELKIVVSNGNSHFTNYLYISHERLPEVIADLNIFREQIHGGLLDLRLGEFGSEYAGGAFHARLQFHELGKIYITCRQQSGFEGFPRKLTANEATMHVITEPVLLDNFLMELQLLNNGNSEAAYLESVRSP